MPAAHSSPSRPALADGAASPIVLSVAFLSPSGDAYRTVGGGASFADAIEFARDSLPPGHEWRLADWADVYGE